MAINDEAALGDRDMGEGESRERARKARPPRLRLSPQQRRSQLIECGLEAFATRGVRRTGHADVAKVAGCAVSTVFVYFPTRDDLVDGILDEVEAHYAEIACASHGEGLAAPDALLEHSRRFRDSIDSHPHHALVLLNWAANVRSRVWARYLEFIERSVSTHRQTIERGIREGTIDSAVDAETAARVIVGYAQMSIQLRLSNFAPERADQISRRMILSLLSPPTTESAASGWHA